MTTISSSFKAEHEILFYTIIYIVLITLNKWLMGGELCFLIVSYLKGNSFLTIRPIRVYLYQRTYGELVRMILVVFLTVADNTLRLRQPCFCLLL